MKTENDFIPVMIICPECKTIQATINETDFAGSKVHFCTECLYCIMDSEWQEIRPFKWVGPLFTLMLICLLSASLQAQNRHHIGKWLLPNGMTIERINDSTQIERYMNWRDTLRIRWIDCRNYLVECPENEWLRVRIMRPTREGYKAMVTDGRKRKYYYVKAI